MGPWLILVTHEFFHGRLPILADPLPLEDFLKSHPENLDIEPERPVVDVPDIVFEFFLPADGIATIDLRPAGDAGAHLVAAGLFRRVAVEVFHQQRARPDQAHVALEDVEQFGEFVEAGGAQEFAEGGQALVVGEQVPLRVALVGHGAELVHGERFTMHAGPGLAEEHGSAVFDPHK